MNQITKLVILTVFVCEQEREYIIFLEPKAYQVAPLKIISYSTFLTNMRNENIYIPFQDDKNMTLKYPFHTCHAKVILNLLAQMNLFQFKQH